MNGADVESAGSSSSPDASAGPVGSKEAVLVPSDGECWILVL